MTLHVGAVTREQPPFRAEHIGSLLRPAVYWQPFATGRMKTLGMGMQENGTANYVQFMKDDLESHAKVIDRLGLRRK